MGQFYLSIILECAWALEWCMKWYAWGPDERSSIMFFHEQRACKAMFRRFVLSFLKCACYAAHMFFLVLIKRTDESVRFVFLNLRKHGWCCVLERECEIACLNSDEWWFIMFAVIPISLWSSLLSVDMIFYVYCVVPAFWTVLTTNYDSTASPQEDSKFRRSRFATCFCFRGQLYL